MRSRFVWISTCAMFLLSSACQSQEGPRDEADSDRDDSLIGGTVVPEPELGAALLLDWGCTAVKVGPHAVLTAAHCVHDSDDNKLLPAFASGGKIDLVTANRPFTDKDIDAKTFTVTLESTTIHPQWMADCQAPCPVNVLGADVPPDLAVLRIKEETPAIPAARVDLRKVEPGEGLVVMGYGCEVGLSGPDDTLRLKSRATHALAATALDAPSDFPLPDHDRILSSYVITPGHDGNAAEASLCPGDSGGPLFRDDGTERNVVGINAYYTFAPGNQQVSQTNWHTRLDEESRFDVGPWLASLGVDVVSSDSCAARCCDGAVVHAGDELDDNKCIFWAGSGCADHGGPVRVRRGGDVVWATSEDQCSTLRSCSARCCDGTLSQGSQQFDPDMCVLVEASQCDGHGGALRVRFDGAVAWAAEEGQCQGAESAATCSARCCDDTLVQVPGLSDPNQCIFWAGFGCAENGGPVRVRYGGDPVWEVPADQCSTMRPCAVTCCDGALLPESDHFDANMCVFFGVPKCDPHGGAMSVQYDGSLKWESSSCK